MDKVGEKLKSTKLVPIFHKYSRSHPPHTFTHTHSHTHSLSLTHPPTPTHTFTHTLTHTHSLSHTHTDCETCDYSISFSAEEPPSYGAAGRYPVSLGAWSVVMWQSGGCGHWSCDLSVVKIMHNCISISNRTLLSYPSPFSLPLSLPLFIPSPSISLPLSLPPLHPFSLCSSPSPSPSTSLSDGCQEIFADDHPDTTNPPKNDGRQQL